MENCRAKSARFLLNLCYYRAMGDGRKDIMREYLSSLSIEPEIAEIYIALKLNGPQTISALSRITKIERTKLYRLIDGILDSNLFEIETENKRNLISAAPVENLEVMVQKKIDEADAVKKQFNSIKEIFSVSELKVGSTKLKVYKGPEGIKQIKLKSLRAKKEVRTVANRPFSPVVGVQFFIDFINKANEKNLKFKLIFDTNFQKESIEWRASHQKHEIPKFASAEAKLIYPFEFKIETNIDIWDDTVVFYNWQNPEDVYAIEIESKELASTHRQLFDKLFDSNKA